MTPEYLWWRDHGKERPAQALRATHQALRYTVAETTCVASHHPFAAKREVVAASHPVPRQDGAPSAIQVESFHDPEFDGAANVARDVHYPFNLFSEKPAQGKCVRNVVVNAT